MRAFIALELSNEIKNELARLQGELKKVGADIKWVKSQNIHLTLKFLGDIDEGKVEQIKKILDQISSQNKTFEISPFKLGAFPNIDNPRVVWAGIDKGCSNAEQIAQSVEDELSKIGFEKESRPFSAHFTLGRVKSGKNKAALKESFSSVEARPESCAINSITLFQSTLTPQGPIYSSLHKAKLI